MANVTPPYEDGFGRAAFDVLDVYTQNFLLSGAEPRLQAPVSMKQKANTTLAQFTVVGIDGNGDIVKAVLGTTAAIGVLAHANATDGTNDANAQVFYSGCFDPSALVWDATYDTDAKKEAAFRGAATPTTIVIRKRA